MFIDILRAKGNIHPKSLGAGHHCGLGALDLLLLFIPLKVPHKSEPSLPVHLQKPDVRNASSLSLLPKGDPF